MVVGARVILKEPSTCLLHVDTCQNTPCHCYDWFLRAIFNFLLRPPGLPLSHYKEHRHLFIDHCTVTFSNLAAQNLNNIPLNENTIIYLSTLLCIEHLEFSQCFTIIYNIALHILLIHRYRSSFRV